MPMAASCGWREEANWMTRVWICSMAPTRLAVVVSQGLAAGQPRSGASATSMIQRTGGESPDPGPDGGNPIPRRQGHRCGAPRLWRRDANVVGPARGCLVEVIGTRPDPAKAKRRKASALGEPARSGEAQYPHEARVYWRGGGREVLESYLARSAGFRASGSRPERKNEER